MVFPSKKNRAAPRRFLLDFGPQSIAAFVLDGNDDGGQAWIVSCRHVLQAVKAAAPPKVEEGTEVRLEQHVDASPGLASLPFLAIQLTWR